MIPKFKKSGLLPQGTHYSTWEELVTRFGTNSHRLQLLDGLKKGLNVLIRYGCVEVCIDGSFVTDKEFPGDIDVCYNCSYMNWQKFTKEQPEFVSRKDGRDIQKQKYKCEFYAYDAFDDSMFWFYQYDKNNNPKGIVKLSLAGKIL